MWKNKFFWLNLIAIVLAAIQYFVDKGMFENLIPWFGLAVIILNMVAGMIQGNTLTKANAKINNLVSALKSYQPK